MNVTMHRRWTRHGYALVLSVLVAMCATIRTRAGSIGDERGNVGYDTAAECDAAVASGGAKFYTSTASQPPSRRSGEVDVKTIELRDLTLARKAVARAGYQPAGYARGACDQAGDGVSRVLVGKWIPYAPDTRLNAYSGADGVVVRVTLNPSDAEFARRLPRPVSTSAAAWNEAAARSAWSRWPPTTAAGPEQASHPASTPVASAGPFTIGAVSEPLAANTAAPPSSTAASSSATGTGSACYATVVTPPRFEMRPEVVVKVPASKRTEVVAATYKDVEERILVTPEHKRQIPIPATYKTVYEDVVVRPAGEREEPIAATYKTVTEQVQVKAESKRIEVIPATYKTVTEQVVVTPETKSLRVIPATYKFEQRRVVDRPASTRVETVPATFKTVTERVMVTPESVRYEALVLPMRTVSEQVLLSASSSRVETAPATYKTVTERVVVKDASRQLVEVPAVYTTVTERVKVADATKEWKRGQAWLSRALSVSSVKKLNVGTDGTVNGVKVDMRSQPDTPVGTSGIGSAGRTTRPVNRSRSARGVAAASPRAIDADDDVMCLVEIPERYELITRQVVKTPASVREVETPAEYATVTRQVLDRQAESRSVEIPATYQTVTRQVVDVERMKVLGYKFDERGDVVATPSNERVLRAASIPGWSGSVAGRAADGAASAQASAASPTSSAGAASGLEGYVREVKVAAVYRDQVRTVEDRPATVRTIEVPATYKTVSVKVEVTPARTEEVVMPATHKTVTRQVVDREATSREVAVPAVYTTVDRRVVETPASTRKIPVAAVTEKVARRVIDVPASFREELVPAVYQTVIRRVIDRPASIREVEVPAVTETLYNRVQVAEATSARRAVLCETNASARTILGLQRALKQAGYDPGALDGRIGPSMVAALTRYQEAKGLPVDDGRVINVETVRSLGVSPE